MHKHRKYKFEELDNWEKQAFLEEKEKVYYENIQRIRANCDYTNREIKEFISFSKKFDNPTAAISLLHNCHVIRTNNEYVSEPIKIVAALKAALGNDSRTSSLEKATEILSSQPSYIIKTEELERKKNERKLKARTQKLDAKTNSLNTEKEKNEQEKDIEKEKNIENIGKQKDSKENKNETNKEQKMSEMELKRIKELEERFGRRIIPLGSESEGNVEKDHFDEDSE